MEYAELLEEAYKKVKLVKKSSDRFEIPKAEGHVEGNKTIIDNFKQLADYLRRDSWHFSRFLLKELAAPGKIEGERLILIKRVPSSKINEKIADYVREFVICKECGKPDTELVREDRISFVHCLACGAKHSVRSKI